MLWEKKHVTRCHLYLESNGRVGYSVSFGSYWIGPFFSKTRVKITYPAGDVREEVINLPTPFEIICRPLPYHTYLHCFKYEALRYIPGHANPPQSIYAGTMNKLLDAVRGHLQHHAISVAHSEKAIRKAISIQKNRQ